MQLRTSRFFVACRRLGSWFGFPFFAMRRVCAEKLLSSINRKAVMRLNFHGVVEMIAVVKENSEINAPAAKKKGP